jgi:hypothetical protein
MWSTSSGLDLGSNLLTIIRKLFLLYSTHFSLYTDF